MDEPCSGSATVTHDAEKNWLAMDGLGFQAVEQVYGMETALAMDRNNKNLPGAGRPEDEGYGRVPLNVSRNG
jgi:hypothetical protein